MAKKNQPDVAATSASADLTSADPNATAAPAADKPPRKEVDRTKTIYWNEARDKDLMREILSAPGQLSTAALAERLALRDSFAADKHLLADEGAPEKIRQHVKKLDARSRKLYGKPLELKRASNARYGAADAMAELFAELGIAPVVQAPVADTDAQVQTAPDVAQNQSPIPAGVIPLVPANTGIAGGGVIGGGLIPT